MTGRGATTSGEDRTGRPGLDWGTDPDLSPFEIVMWRADVDRRLRSTMMAVEVLDAAPDWDRLVAALRWAVRMVPRLRDRVAAPLWGAGTPRWEPDPDFDLHRHARRIALPGPGSWTTLLETAEQIAMTPLDPRRPLWEAVLVEGLEGGRAALLIKFHHALGDGLGITQLLSGLHSRTRAHTEDKPWPPVPEVTATETVAGALARQAREDAVAAGSALGSLARSAGRGLGDLVRRPATSTRAAVGWLASARRVLSPPEAPPLPLLATRNGSWRFRTLDVELADLRSAAKAVDGSLNDAYLAALLGAFRRYHGEMGRPIGQATTMPVSVPVSVRRAADDAGGNRFAPGRLAAPVGIVAPDARMAAVSAAMRRVRAEPALESADILTPLLARLPGALVAELAGDMTPRNDLQASNVPGLREDVFLAGARIERIYPFAPLPGCAAMITLLTHGTTCCIGANLDAAAVREPDLFARCLADGFTEVLALGGGTATPIMRS
ncbi:wax ester/triacylglycerol synthase family O-acyltransferase [Actinomycetospora chibensis]|uniref:Diacylglycerol O-acyltransferase n=1 Tax=Actinomycetospora chibensis TaxID=663606 RepID=A0ABV9RD42_9PSEU|nr:wax ester/triacylglycerol synthase family O-acyltransferase [Actinomycetospora chibensis]MDD7925040.1 wax ester/triacylglycerol synthase family O-acyltransferase [Actinomycetospora chibensis]